MTAYALPTVTDVKNYLRIRNTVEDALLATLLLAATGMVEAYINRPILARPLVDLDDAVTFAAYGVVRTLQTKVWPIAPADPAAVPPVLGLTVTDTDLVPVDVADYRVDLGRGTITGLGDYVFDNGPYTLAYTGGLSAFPTWNTVQGPIVGQAILDTCADLWSNRTPLSQSESEGGVSVTWGQKFCSPRTMKLLAAVSPVSFV